MTISNQLTFSGTAYLGFCTVHQVFLLKNGILDGSNTFEELNLNPGYEYQVGSGGVQTIVPGGTLNASGSGCGAYVTIKSYSPGNQATISKSGAAVTLQYIRLMDILASGGATFTANSSVDLGNNSGWTLSPIPSRTLYWVGGGGNWSDPLHWSLSSGGPSGECPPSADDDVFFNAGSGFSPGEEVHIDVPSIYCRNMDWTGVLNNPVLSGGNYLNKMFLYGSLRFDAGMQINFEGEVRFRATSAGQVLFMAGKIFGYYVHFEGPGGEWTLLDGLAVAFGIYHTAGTLRTNGQPLTIKYGIYGNGGVLDLGASVVTFEQPDYPNANFYNYAPDNFFVGTSHFKFLNGGSISSRVLHNVSFLHPTAFGGVGAETVNGTVYFEGPGGIYGNFVREAEFRKNGNIGSFGAAITFEKLRFAPGYSYILNSGNTVKITPLGDFIAQGTGGFPIEIKSNTFGSQATLHKDGDPICLDFLYLTDIAAAGTAFAYAGANSDNVSNNSDWLFEACPPCFNAPPTPAPTLDPASVISVQPGEQATLIVDNLPANHNAVWFNSDQSAELYASENNIFQPTINQPTAFYGAVRDQATGCVSALLAVPICPGSNDPLIISCPTGVPALTANSSCQAFLGDYTGLATLSGGCGIPLDPIVQTPLPGKVVNPGTVAITLTVSNTAGQSATCVFNVAVSGGCGN